MTPLVPFKPAISRYYDPAVAKANVDKSKMEPKVAKPKLGTAENEAAMQKASKP